MIVTGIGTIGLISIHNIKAIAASDRVRFCGIDRPTNPGCLRAEICEYFVNVRARYLEPILECSAYLYWYYSRTAERSSCESGLGHSYFCLHLDLGSRRRADRVRSHSSKQESGIGWSSLKRPRTYSILELFPMRLVAQLRFRKRIHIRGRWYLSELCCPLPKTRQELP